MADAPNQTRLLAKLIRELMAGETFDSLSDLTGALKDRCAKLRIEITDQAINGAFTLIASNTPLTAPSPLLQKQAPWLPATQDFPAMSHAAAAAILQRLGVRVSGGRVARQTDDDDDFPGLVEV